MLTNKKNISEMVADAMQPRPYIHCGGADYSATSLIRSPRQVQLEKRHKHKIQDDVLDHWSFFMGNAIHEKIEKQLDLNYPGRYMVERKITRFDLGRRVVAKVDAYDTVCKRVADHKTSKIGNRRDPKLWTEFKEEWKNQLAINAYFIEAEGKPVESLSINQIFLDWKPFSAKVQSADVYPQVPVVELVVPAPPQEEREAYYLERLQLHIDNEDVSDELLPECTPEECWESPSRWSVQQRSTGRSRKLCPTRSEAVAWMKANVAAGSRPLFEIVHRPGCRLKCEEFCSVNKFCNQYRDYIMGKCREEEETTCPED